MTPTVDPPWHVWLRLAPRGSRWEVIATAPTKELASSLMLREMDRRQPKAADWCVLADGVDPNERTRRR